MIEFNVLGEMRHDPGHMVLLDGDGQCYDYDIEQATITLIEPDGSWAEDVVEEGRLTMVLPEAKIAGAQPVASSRAS